MATTENEVVPFTATVWLIGWEVITGGVDADVTVSVAEFESSKPFASETLT